LLVSSIIFAGISPFTILQNIQSTLSVKDGEILNQLKQMLHQKLHHIS